MQPLDFVECIAIERATYLPTADLTSPRHSAADDTLASCSITIRACCLRLCVTQQARRPFQDSWNGQSGFIDGSPIVTLVSEQADCGGRRSMWIGRGGSGCLVIARGDPVSERARLLEANRAAAVFYRRELLRSATTWPTRYLRRRRLDHVLAWNANWAVGYAPDAWSRTDHLRGQGFDDETLLNAGLAKVTQN
jgi:hypothetical protein